MENTIQVSDSFKKMTVKAIFSIVWFIVVYLVMLLLAFGLTVLCGFAGFMLIIFKPMFLTIMVGLGLISLGVLVLIFLFKFLFSTHKVDRSHLVEITESEEPKLFAFIRNIVEEVGTDFPKKIYLSAEVNAAVFYDSNFWSMFLPIKKNLQIGLGLVNTISETEFKAILAHEFGHFSQKSMKVGSYVYNVNQVIFNMLYDNDSYNNLISQWSGLSSYFSIFVSAAVKIIYGIQSVLKNMYEMINLNYMGLSREMEFHADEVAANIAGSFPLKTSLLRMNLADHSYNTVLNFYSDKITDNLVSKNIYKEQYFIMNFLAKESNLEFENNLPKVSVDELNKYNKSKLNIEDQWSSHPSIEDRILALDKLNIRTENIDNNPANQLFSNFEETQSQLSGILFSSVSYSNPTIFNDVENFTKEYTEKYLENSFDKEYNGYYDNKNVSYFDLSEINSNRSDLEFSDLFSMEKLELIYSSMSLENDIDILTQISNNQHNIKTFDYDGNRYASQEIPELIPTLKAELDRLNGLITENDKSIFLYFSKLSKTKGKEDEFLEKYKTFLDFTGEYDRKLEIYTGIFNATEFVNNTTPFDTIRNNFIQVEKLEIDFKAEIQNILNDTIYQSVISDEIRVNLEKYISKKWFYFYDESYNNDSLTVLFTAMNHYYYLIARGSFLIKKDLLAFQIQLEKN